MLPDAAAFLRVCAQVHFPPEFEATPCKPLLFDIARNHFQPPDLSSRLQAAKRGAASGWGLKSYLFGSSR